jgi:hypothetical protein
MKTYHIPAGKHRSEWHFGLRLRKPRTILISFEINPEKEYNYSALDTQTKEQYNKLFGVNYGILPHRNSARIGWKLEDEGYSLCLYTYVNGKRMIATPLFSANVGEYMVQYAYKLQYGVKYTYMLCIEKGVIELMDISGTNHTLRIPKALRTRGLFSYLLYPYFGGKAPAPVGFNIEITRTFL